MRKRENAWVGARGFRPSHPCQANKQGSVEHSVHEKRLLWMPASVSLQVATVTWHAAALGLAKKTLTELYGLRSLVLAPRSSTTRLAARQRCSETTAAPAGKGILEASLRVLDVQPVFVLEFRATV